QRVTRRSEWRLGGAPFDALTARHATIWLALRKRGSGAARRLEAFEGALLIRPISREHPATSAARIAARRRVWLMSPRPPPSVGPIETVHGAQACGTAAGAVPVRRSTPAAFRSRRALR